MELFVVFLGILLALVGSTFTGIQGRARDTERQTDIKAMHGQVEAYYAQNGLYPSLTEMNDASWRSKNMRGLDIEALKDPDGSETNLSAAPGKDTYSYAPKASDERDCNNPSKPCTTYKLTATLEDGSTYTKSALN